MISYHKEFMDRAIELALENVRSGLGGPFGAVVVKDNVIVAEGTNLVTSSNDPTAHAEITAIRKACQILESFELRDCQVYSSCEPCPMCLGAIYWARPKALFYAATRHDAATAGFDDALIYHEICQPTSSRIIPSAHVGHLRYLDPFNIWRQCENKTRY